MNHHNQFKHQDTRSRKGGGGGDEGSGGGEDSGTWEWWSSPCPLDPAGWYVRIDLDTHYWRVAYRGKVVVSEIFL